jgi:hypothetical protein
MQQTKHKHRQHHQADHHIQPVPRDGKADHSEDHSVATSRSHSSGCVSARERASNTAMSKVEQP